MTKAEIAAGLILLYSEVLDEPIPRDMADLLADLSDVPCGEPSD